MYQEFSLPVCLRLQDRGAGILGLHSLTTGISWKNLLAASSNREFGGISHKDRRRLVAKHNSCSVCSPPQNCSSGPENDGTFVGRESRLFRKQETKLLGSAQRPAHPKVARMGSP